MKLIRLMFVAAIVFAVAAVIVTWIQKASGDEIMMVSGVSCGILASIPVSLGLLIALTRQRRDSVPAYEPPPMQAEPTFIIVMPHPAVSEPQTKFLP